MKNFFKIVVLGSPKVGKTSIIEQAIYGNFYRLNEPYEPTLEDVYCAMVEYDKNMREKIYLYDYAGMVAPLNLDTIKMYLSFCDALILVFAINDHSSLLMLSQIKKTIDRFKEKKDIPIVILANKIDKNNEVAVNLDEVRSWTNQEKIKLFEVSSYDRKSINECLIYLALKFSSFSKSSFSKKSKAGNFQLEL